MGSKRHPHHLAGTPGPDAAGLLQHDHTRLRRALTLVESSLHLGAPARPILQAACRALFGQLQQHVARERPLQVHLRAVLRPVRIADRPAPTHAAPARRLRTIAHHLTSNRAVMPKDIDTALYAVIDDLEQQMELQEQWFFPSGDTPAEAADEVLDADASSREAVPASV